MSDEQDIVERKPGDLAVVGGSLCRFIEAEIEGEKWEVLSPEEAASLIERLRREVEERDALIEYLMGLHPVGADHLPDNHVFSAVLNMGEIRTARRMHDALAKEARHD